MKGIINDIANDKKGDTTVNDRFAHKPDGLLVWGVSITVQT